ncbi:MAG: TerC family protein [Phycisphaerales bacterium]|nr:TerC family protein [Phycisphaerales bacterium]
MPIPNVLVQLAPVLDSVAATAGAATGQPADLRVWAYAGFVTIVLALLALDLGVFHRQAHEVSLREAAGWSVVWVSLGLLFSLFVWAAYDRHWLGLGIETAAYNPAAFADPSAPLVIQTTVAGWEAAKQYLTGFVVEKSLAVDNIFVIAIVFSFFAVPPRYQHRVLFWGILGALAMRGAMIAVGAELVMRASWVLIAFGVFLVATAVKMAVVRSEPDPARNPIVRAARRFLPVHPGFDGQRFFTTVDGVRHVTPLFLALVMVEITDLVFAVDSIPAIFAVTPDPFIVFTSNIFAILGLRSLYFCLGAMLGRFRYLKPALILILLFVGVKLLLLSVPPYLQPAGALLGLDLGDHRPIKIGTAASLLVVVGLLASAVVASVLWPARPDEPDHRVRRLGHEGAPAPARREPD